MFAVAKENGVLLMEAYAYLHSPFMAAIQDELRSGAIGEVLYMESQFMTSDYDVRNIRMRKEPFGGAVYDLGCYTTSQLLWMLEEEPVRVQAIADFSDRGIDTYTAGLLTFADGKRASFLCGMVLATDQDRRIDCLRIHGTRGDLRTDAQFNQSGQLSYVLTVGDTHTVKTVDTPQNYRLEVEQLGRCITDGEQPHVTEAFTLQNTRLMKNNSGPDRLLISRPLFLQTRKNTRESAAADSLVFLVRTWGLEPQRTRHRNLKVMSPQ